MWATAPEDGVGHVMGSEGAHPVRETAVSKDPLSIERIGRIGMSRPYKPPCLLEQQSMTEDGGSGDRETDRQRDRGKHRGGYERAIETLHQLVHAA